MPSTHFWLNALLASSVAALPSKRQADNTMHLDVHKKLATNTPVDAPLTIDNAVVFVQLTLGGNNMYSNLDTGSSNLVVFPKRNLPNGQCNFDQAVCAGISYEVPPGNPKAVGLAYTASYGDGDGGKGAFYTDKLIFEGVTIPDFQFVDLTESNTLSTSVFGTGYQENEGVTDEQKYDNLPLRLVKQGQIKAPIFSLWLNSLRASETGSMLYGGIDPDKYCDSLKKLSIVPDPETGRYREFNVLLDGITSVAQDGSSSTIDITAGSVALFDSGTNTISAPAAVYSQILKAFKGTAPTRARGFPQVACSMAQDGPTISFNFNGKIIPVAPKELVDTTGETQGQCNLFISIQTNTPTFILGTSFLSSAYVVHDLLNNQIQLGRANPNGSGANSKVQPVGTGPNAVPVAAGAVCSPVGGSTTTSTTSMSSTMSTSTMSTTGSTTTTKSGTSTSASSTSGSSVSASSTTSGGKSSTTTMSGMTTSSATSMTTGTGKTSGSSQTGKPASTTASSYANTWANWSGTSSPVKAITTNTWANWASTSTPVKAITTNTWANWASTSTQVKATTKSDPYATWSTWNADPSKTKKTTPAVTSAATWSAWNGASTQSLSYSTVTSTIYVCPYSKKDCAQGDKTKTVTVYAVPYTTSTIYSTKTVTITASCPSGTVCNGAYYTTSTSVIAVTTTVYVWSGSASATATAATWSGVSSPVAVTASWSGVSSPVATSWSAVSSPVAASSWSAASGTNSAWVAAYTGGASSSYSIAQAMTLVAVFVGSTLFMLI